MYKVGGSERNSGRVDTRRTTVTRNEVHGGEETRRGVTKGSAEVRDGVHPFSGAISSLASTKAF